ncbi:uncharacterized protein LOC121877932 isoform X2 [Homarus americanus]|uniref:uncharacterized protein LOC121877932 isoform X2 n=1 Tax=Homarus americanus TaxID=6706 RepID=UPI001C461156|nr:uncharacterized protein LOC121877932 isoform X2 [Homarus americanus]
MMMCEVEVPGAKCTSRAEDGDSLAELLSLPPTVQPLTLHCSPHHKYRRDASINNPNNDRSLTKEKDYFPSPNNHLLKFYHLPIGRSSPDPQPNGISGLPTTSGVWGWLWVVTGDSRMRQVFSALVTRLNSPRLKYRNPSTGGKWRSVHELVENLRIGKLHQDIEVQHLDVPLRLVFHWDPLLLKLPALLNHWTDQEEQRPTLLLLGSSLHWMKTTLNTFHTSGPQAALDKFKKHMNTFLPQLTKFAETTSTIIQLQDHLQESRIFRKYRGIYSNSNIDLYNNFLSSYLTGSSITIWDSNIPFSDTYITQCVHGYKKSFDKLWDCGNPLHTGFIMIEKYANMFLNDVCNSYFDLNATYC